MKGWGKCELGDVLTFQRGFDLPNQRRVHGEYPIVSSNGISDYHNEFKVKGPGIVTGRYGTIGEVFFIRDNFWPLNTSLFVKDFKGNDIRFLSYLLKTINIKGLNAAGAVPGVNRNHLHKIKIRIPPLPTQRRIASILSAYDDLIENNLKHIKLLEELAQRAYEEWFVRMKFPGHENTPINAETGLPEGWERKKLGDVANIFYGYPFKANQFNTDNIGTPIIRIRNIPTAATNDFTTEIVDEKYKVVTGDLLVGMDGEFYINNWPGPEAYLVQRSCNIKPKKEELRGYLSQAIVRPIKFFEATISGATVAHLGKKHLDTIELLIPNKNKYFDPFNAWMKLKLNLAIQNRLLKESRDILLPRLMGGEIGVEEAEIQMNMAAEPEVNYKKN